MKLFQLLKCVRKLRQVLVRHEWKPDLQAGTVVVLLLFAFWKPHGLLSCNKVILCFYIIKAQWGLWTAHENHEAYWCWKSYWWYSVRKDGVFLMLLLTLCCSVAAGLLNKEELLQRVLAHLLLEKSNPEPSMIQKNLSDFSENPLRIIPLTGTADKVIF